MLVTQFQSAIAAHVSLSLGGRDVVVLRELGNEGNKILNFIGKHTESVFDVFEVDGGGAVVEEGEAVGDEDDGLIAGAGLEGDVLDELLLGLGVEGRSGFVEQEDIAVTQERPSDGDSLGLTFRKAFAGLAAMEVQTLLLAEDELGTRHSERDTHLLVGGVGIAEKEVVADGTGEEGVALGDVDEVTTGARRGLDRFRFQV